MREYDEDRGMPIAKGYVDDVGRGLLILIVIMVVITSLINGCHASKLRNLQRRVGQLESERQ